MAMNADLEIIPLINKIDLPSAEPERVKGRDRGRAWQSPPTTRCLPSGKDGRRRARPARGCGATLFPSPEGNAERPAARAHLRLAISIRIAAWSRWFAWSTAPSRRATRLRLVDAGTEILVEEVGARHPKEVAAVRTFAVGEVGYLVTGLKDVVPGEGGRYHHARGSAASTEPLPGYREAKPMVYTGLFPIESDQYEPLEGGPREALAERSRAVVGARESPTRSASASASASWAFCTWRS